MSPKPFVAAFLIVGFLHLQADPQNTPEARIVSIYGDQALAARPAYIPMRGQKEPIQPVSVALLADRLRDLGRVHSVQNELPRKSTLIVQPRAFYRALSLLIRALKPPYRESVIKIRIYQGLDDRIRITVDSPAIKDALPLVEVLPVFEASGYMVWLDEVTTEDLPQVLEPISLLKRRIEGHRLEAGTTLHFLELLPQASFDEIMDGRRRQYKLWTEYQIPGRVPPVEPQVVARLMQAAQTLTGADQEILAWASRGVRSITELADKTVLDPRGIKVNISLIADLFHRTEVADSFWSAAAILSRYSLDWLTKVRPHDVRFSKAQREESNQAFKKLRERLNRNSMTNYERNRRINEILFDPAFGLGSPVDMGKLQALLKQEGPYSQTLIRYAPTNRGYPIVLRVQA